MGNLFSYIIIYILTLAIQVAVAIYVYRLRKKIDEMHGMMIGMAFGMMAGLTTATLFLIPTGNFLYGVIIGSIVGILFGVPFGKLGGHLGIVEGVFAGPMGGMMGAMLGQMIRPFNIDIFIPFFMFIFLITMIGVTYAVNCRVNYYDTGSNQKRSHTISNEFITSWSLTVIVLLTISIFFPFSIESNQQNDQKILSSFINSQDKNLTTTLFSQGSIKEERKEAVVKDSYQEIDLQITALKYSPDVIIARSGIPLKINVRADENAGCAREIIFPDFNIDKIIPAGGLAVIKINPAQEGEFVFRCSMDMVRGKLIIIP